jgi:hypothetical protein
MSQQQLDIGGVYLSLGHSYQLNSSKNSFFILLCSDWKDAYNIWYIFS